VKKESACSPHEKATEERTGRHKEINTHEKRLASATDTDDLAFCWMHRTSAPALQRCAGGWRGAGRRVYGRRWKN